jgi:hypothetical protein
VNLKNARCNNKDIVHGFKNIMGVVKKIIYLTISYEVVINKCSFHLYGECNVTDYCFGRQSDIITQMTSYFCLCRCLDSYCLKPK